MPSRNRMLVRFIACKAFPLGLAAAALAGAAQAAALASNSFTFLPVQGAPGTFAQGQLAFVNQTYADQSSKKYLLADISVPIPNAALAIGTVPEASQASLIASFSRAGAAEPYAECRLEPRAVMLRAVSFSVGLKSTGDQALIRWGVCKDPNVPGYNSIFPDLQAGDLMAIKAKNGGEIGRYTVPAAANPSVATSARQNVVFSLLLGKSFKVAP